MKTCFIYRPFASAPLVLGMLTIICAGCAGYMIGHRMNSVGSYAIVLAFSIVSLMSLWASLTGATANVICAAGGCCSIKPSLRRIASANYAFVGDGTELEITEHRSRPNMIRITFYVSGKIVAHGIFHRANPRLKDLVHWYASFNGVRDGSKKFDAEFS